jgi:hypothetical protein
MFEEGLVAELMALYRQERPGATNASQFRAWLADQPQNTALQLLWQHLQLLYAVLGLHEAIRRNEPVLKAACRAAFAPVWWARNHPNMQRIVLEDERNRAVAPARMRLQLDAHLGSRRHHTIQGHDAILEEVNKELKEWAGTRPDALRWVWLARTLPHLQALRRTMQALLGISRTDAGVARTRPDSAKELAAWRRRLRSSPALARAGSARPAPVSVAGKVLSAQALRLVEEGRQRRLKAVRTILSGGIVHARDAPAPVPLTLAEEASFAAESAKKVAHLRRELQALCEANTLPLVKGLRTKAQVLQALADARERASILAPAHAADTETPTPQAEALQQQQQPAQWLSVDALLG